MKDGSDNKRQSSRTNAIWIIVIVISFFFGGYYVGYRDAISDVLQANASRTAANCQIMTWTTAIEGSQKCQQLEREEELKRIIMCLDHENEIIVRGLRELFRGVKIETNLRIWWNRERLQPWTAILVYNIELLPTKFLDQNGFVYPHWAKRGDEAVFIGEDSGMVTVFCLTGPFAGELITFRPQMRKDQQGVLAYHF